MVTADVRVAESIARLAHFDTYRKWHVPDVPYITHVERVVALLTSWGVEDPTIISAAWLHDVVEDHPKQFPYERLIREVGMDAMVLVYYLTKEGHTKEERSASMVRKLQVAPWQAQLIKIADRTDNLRDYPVGKMPYRYIEEASLIESLARDKTYKLRNVDLTLLRDACDQLWVTIRDVKDKHGFLPVEVDE